MEGVSVVVSKLSLEDAVTGSGGPEAFCRAHRQLVAGQEAATVPKRSCGRGHPFPPVT